MVMAEKHGCYNNSMNKPHRNTSIYQATLNKIRLWIIQRAYLVSLHVFGLWRKPEYMVEPHGVSDLPFLQLHSFHQPSSVACYLVPLLQEFMQNFRNFSSSEIFRQFTTHTQNPYKEPLEEPLLCGDYWENSQHQREESDEEGRLLPP